MHDRVCVLYKGWTGPMLLIHGNLNGPLSCSSKLRVYQAKEYLSLTLLLLWQRDSKGGILLRSRDGIKANSGVMVPVVLNKSSPTVCLCVCAKIHLWLWLSSLCRHTVLLMQLILFGVDRRHGCVRLVRNALIFFTLTFWVCKSLLGRHWHLTVPWFCSRGTCQCSKVSMRRRSETM